MRNHKRNQENTVGRVNRGQRWIALALCLVLSFSLLPTSALAAASPSLTKEQMAAMSYSDVMNLSAAQAKYVYDNNLFYALPIDLQMRLIKDQFKTCDHAYLDLLASLQTEINRTRTYSSNCIYRSSYAKAPTAVAKITTRSGELLVDFAEVSTANGRVKLYDQFVATSGDSTTGAYASRKADWDNALQALIREEIAEVKDGYEWFNSLGAEQAYSRIFKQFCANRSGKELYELWNAYRTWYAGASASTDMGTFSTAPNAEDGQYFHTYGAVSVVIDERTVYFASPYMLRYIWEGTRKGLSPNVVSVANKLDWSIFNDDVKGVYPLGGSATDFRYQHNSVEFWREFAKYVEGDSKFTAHKRWVETNNGEGNAKWRNDELDRAAFFYVTTHTETEVKDYIARIKSPLEYPTVSINGYDVELSEAERTKFAEFMLTHVDNGYARDVTAGNPEDVQQNNMYLLRVDTGVNAGKDVMYFAIRYFDGKDERTEVVMPHMGSLTQGYRMAEAFDSPAKRLELMNSITGYTVGNGYEAADGLMANSFDTYLFRTGYPIKELLSIDVFMNYPTQTRATDWLCSGMYLYDVETVYGVKMAGYCSDSYSISFKGEMIAKLYNDDVDFTVGKSDKLYRVPAKSTAEIEGMNVQRNDTNQPYIELVAGTAPERFHDDAVNEFLFKIDFADLYGAGIEALATEVEDDRRLKQPVEAMTLEVRYYDDTGEVRTVDMPMITSMLTWAVENTEIGLPRRLPIVGVAQQGESVMFPGVLPNFKAFASIDLYYGPIAEEKAKISLASDAAYSAVRSRRMTMLEKDAIQITGIQLYRYDEKMVEAELTNDAMLTLSVKDEYKPIYYYTSINASGWKIAPSISKNPLLSVRQPSGDVTGSIMSAYTSGPLAPTGASSSYIVLIETDDMPSAATTEDVSLTLEYKSTDGMERTTNPILLRGKAQEFYGYWPGKGGEDVSYYAAMSAGGTLVFGLNLTDVAEFTKATFSMSSYATDEWQMKSFRILRADSAELGKRVAQWKDIDNSDRLFTREFNAEDAGVAVYPNSKDSGEEKVFVSGLNNQVTVELNPDTSSTIVTEKDPFNWAELQYSMTFKESKQDLGFVQTSVTYRVDVEVASNALAGGDDDDCGSRNLFYFKLIFENGNSGYVLANQQLTADGFRAGRTESFYVNTNKDYGTLSAISIIPEDNSGSDNQDPFDKLNVSRIVVTKDSGGGLTKTWQINNVGWIDIDYYDRGAESTGRGRTGRTEGEMARSYVVGSEGYSVNLMFALATKGYERKPGDVFATDDNLYNPALEGSVVATIEYFDRSGMLRRQSIDVVRAMYDYDGKVPQYYGEKYTTSDGTAETRAKIDKAYMFRGNHIDRFMVSLLDVRQIKSIEFGVSAAVATRWNLDSVTVYRVMSDGRLQLNEADEFQHSNEVVKLCESTNVMGYEVQTLAPFTERDVLGAEQALTVEFNANPIEIEETESGWSVTMKELPDNRNDTLNLYVHMMDEDAMAAEHPGLIQTALSEYTMQGVVQYGSAQADKTDTLILRDWRVSAENNMFYCEGVKAAGFSTIRSVALRASAPAFVNAYVDYVDIQHVRSGVTVGTYRVYFGKNAEPAVNGGTSGYLTADKDDIKAPDQTDEQTVYLYLAPGTESTNIKKDENDLVVSIRYRTSNGASGAACDSRNVFLSSLGYTSISAGAVLEIPFQESFANEILGITVTKIGKNAVVVDSAYAALKSDGEEIGWYSFSVGGTISAAPSTLTPSYYNVMPVELTITGGIPTVVEANGDLGGEAPVRLIVRYHNANSAAVETHVIQDIRDYITSGSLKADGTAVVKFALKNARGIRSISLEPYTTNVDTSAVWDVKTLKYEYEIGYLKESYISEEQGEIIVETYPGGMNSANGEVEFKKGAKEIELNTTIYEGSALVTNLSAIQVKLEATSYNPETNVNQMLGSTINDNLAVAISADRALTVAATLIGSLDGYGMTSSLYKGGELLDNEKNAYYSMDNRSILFNPLEAGTYLFVVASEEDPAKQATLTITVSAASTETEGAGGAKTGSESGIQSETGSESEAGGGTEQSN